MRYCFGVDVGGTTVKMGFFQEDGVLLDKWEIKTRVENEGAAVLPDIANSISEKLVEHQVTKEDVVGIGMGVPAPVTKEGVVKNTANLGWGYKEVKRELEELTGMNAYIGNDANVAALGEMWIGAGKGYKNLVMVTLGTGVGGGIIIEENVLVGTNGAGAEIGHINVNPNETENCGCGNKGCLEQYASATGIVRLAKRKLADTTEATVLNVETVTAKDVFDAVKENDKVALEIADEFGSYIGRGLSIVATMCDPEVFVIGGGVSKAGEILLDYIKEPFMKYAFFANEDVKFVLAQLGNDAGIYGAARLTL